MENQAEKHILIVEDDIKLARLTAEYLEQNGFTVSLHHSGEAAVETILNLQPDLVLLDIMLPVKEGTVICREVRDRYHGAVLMLTARDNDMDELLGLELGADDYIAKPIQPRLLLARIHTVLRRIGPASQIAQVHLTVGSMTINQESREVIVDGVQIDLTDAEFDLLRLLTERCGTIVGREQLLQLTRGIDYNGVDRSIDNRISRLRKKLPADSVVIKTVRGKGYLLTNATTGGC